MAAQPAPEAGGCPSGRNNGTDDGDDADFSGVRGRLSAPVSLLFLRQRMATTPRGCELEVLRQKVDDVLSG